MKKQENYTGKLKQIPVKKKLNYLTRFLIGALLIVGIMSGFSLTILESQTKNITEKWMPSLSLAHQMNSLTSDYRLKQYQLLASEDDAEISQAEQDLTNIEQQIKNASVSYQQKLNAEVDTELFNTASGLWDSYKEKSNEMLDLGRAGKVDEAMDMMLGDASDYYNQFQGNFDQLVAYNEDGSAKAARVAAILFAVVIVAIVVIVLLSIGIAFQISRKVTKVILEPLHEIRHALGEIGSGQLQTEITYESKDEFGELAVEVNSFIQSLNLIISDEIYLLEEMAHGNFDVNSRETARYMGGFAPILESMRGIKNKLGSALSSIQEAGYQIDGASNQLAVQAQELASGATEQASTVEQLAASIEEVTNQSIASAEGAEDASKMASEVQEQVENSNEQMNQVVQAMDIINQTSNEISTIIEAIENIASQTNLLSLNASIEAARAGEAGRGFAVVASEIGELAQECSKAANNTRQLIEKSVTQTENGNVIVKETAEALHVVTEQVGNVVMIADKVKENSRTQEASMKEVEQGVGVISRVVENNSASAEECSATSEELSANAETLKERLAEFRFEA